MHLRQFTWPIVAAFVLAASAGANAQTLVNPDISVVGDSRLNLLKGETAEARGVREVDFEFREIEFNFNAYLNPYMRADVFVGIHGDEGPVEVEQGSITVLRGLPASAQLTVGKYLVDMGRLNTQHPHQWGWLEFPLMHRTMLGAEGARVIGANVSTLQSVGETAVTLSLNAFSGDSFGHSHAHDEVGHGHGEDEHAEDDATHEREETPAEIMYSGRISAFRSFTDYLSSEFGGWGFFGEIDPAHGLEQRIFGADWKLRWRPDTYRAFVWVAETMLSSRDVIHVGGEGEHGEVEAEHEVETIDAIGAFTAVDYQFRRRYDVGAFFDWTQDAVVEDAETNAFGAFFGFMPAEETARFSVVYRWENSDLYRYDNQGVTFQVVWSLGPHKPHSY
jgi:hypothetical protein